MGQTNNIIENINIRDIHLIHINSKREPLPAPENANVDISCEPVLEQQQQNGYLSIICKYDLKVHDTDRDVKVMDIHAEYCVVYKITNSAEKVRGNDEKSLAGSAVFNTWPSFRELVHRLIIDAGLSPLVLPTLTEKKLKEFKIKQTSQQLD